MTAHTLLVPIHLDALVLGEPRLSVGPSAHFTRLPHVWKGADVNPDVPNLGKSVVAPPFQDQSFRLDKGVHLHWALPDGLTRAHHPDHGGSGPGHRQSGGFPAVPNRWLVVRHREHAGQWVVDNEWVVESDYLFGDDHDAADHVSVPSAWSDPDPRSPAKRPFRYMGRQMARSAYPASLNGGSYLSRPLTAMGYGEPTFATVYQNCHSVFGLHDPDLPTVDTRYDVFGWYSDPKRDPLRDALHGGKDGDGRAEAVASRFGWRVDKAREIPVEVQTICFVSMTIPAKRRPRQRSRKVEIAVGNSASEALSAYLAATIDGGARRDAVEDQLESVLLDARLSGAKLDRVARLADARHEKGFVARFGGWVWMAKPEEHSERRLQDADREPEEPAILDPELARRLTHLNALQRTYHQLEQEVEGARAQLFADWCKYMQVVYPPEATWQDHETFDGDELRAFIERQADAVEALAQAQLTETACALARAHHEANARLAEINQVRARQEAKLLVLQKIPGPRFYRPTEPVLLIHGEAVRVTERHGQDGREEKDELLRCHLATAALLSSESLPDTKALCAQIDILRAEGPTDGRLLDRIGFCTWEEPWHPILLEWEVDVLPIRRGGHSGGDDYASDHVTSHYTLAPNAVELTPTDAVPGDPRNQKTYRGASILTPHARRQHAAALRACVVEHCRCSHEHLENQLAMVEADHRAKLLEHGQPDDDPVCTALCALGEIDDKEFLSQALTGFNEALLGLHQSYQLPVGDVLGFACEQELARRVGDLVLSCNRSAPDDAGGFDPIRAGRLRVRRLRLVDTFGQIEDLDVGGAPLYASRPLRASASDDLVLPPRFVQPARVNLRWLSTENRMAETSAAPASTPICGWLIVDKLDRSLLVYDVHGRALGVVASGSKTGLWQAGWQMAPGNESATQVWNIEDPHLRQVAEWLVDRSKAHALEDVLDNIEAALDGIDPEAGAHHEDLAVLMARPLAVVRAQLSVSLAGPPAIHQGVPALFTDMGTNTRRTDKFEKVKIPIRLGAHERANDGLVAYWLETRGHLGAEAHWPQVTEVAPILVAPSAHQEPQTLTMLVDPLAAVHATSGVLPTKSITIPASMYAAELKRIQVSFRSLGPILTRIGRLDLPLPSEPGYAWSWIERDDRGWTAVADDLGGSEDDGAFSGAIVAREGWLQLTTVEPGDSAPRPAQDPESSDQPPR